jgi:N-acetylneuraminic acid mutarotase
MPLDPAGSYLTSAELYATSTGKWSVTGSMNTARAVHTATLLQNGQVLVAGGNNTSNFGQTSSELYDPSTGKWAVTGSMSAARQGHTATLLNTGKVLVAGGDNSKGNLSSAELYDPSLGTWSKTGRYWSQGATAQPASSPALNCTTLLRARGATPAV